VIELDLEVPLFRFTLRVRSTFPAGVTAVMGPSGSGKTSLLEAVAGLRGRARGRIAVEGRTLLDTAKGVRLAPEVRHVGYVPQDAGLFPHLTVGRNVAFGARRDPPSAVTAVETLEIGGLLDRYPASLSGGEKQRVALARALATRPRLLLLDEPLAALDIGLRERILPYLVRIRDSWRVPILYVTHNVGEALSLAGHVVLMREGGVEAQGPPLQLLSSPSLAREAESGIENLLAGHVVAHDAEGGVTAIRLESGARVSAPLASDRPLGAAVTVAVRSEDVLVSAEPVRGLSARNVFPARVLALERIGPDALLRCALAGEPGPPWLARLTPAAVGALGLRPGMAVWLAVKSHSVRLV
jgi:molybdate transport system ATP-binding protein